MRDGPRTSGATGGVARRLEHLKGALLLRKFAGVLPDLVVFACPEHYDDLCGELVPALPACCVLPLSELL